MRAILIVAAVALVLMCRPATGAFLEEIAPDAVILARPMDGSMPGDTLEGVSWEIAIDPWPGVLGGRDVWCDVITPTGTMGIGGSVDIVPDGPACLGAGCRDSQWFGYLGAHLEIQW